MDRIIDAYDDLEDFDRMLNLARDRLMPVVEWLEHHEDPAARCKVSRAMIILLVVEEVRSGRATPEDVERVVGQIARGARDGSFASSRVSFQ